MNAPQTGGLGGTYAGNPVACAAALGVFEAFEDSTLLENALAIEAAARALLRPSWTALRLLRSCGAAAPCWPSSS